MNILNKALGIVENAASHGPAVDHMLEVCHWFMLALFVGWITYFLITIWKFRKSVNPKADYYGVRGHASTHIEATVILIEAVLLLGFGIPLWNARVAGYSEVGKEKDTLYIRAVGYQFGWNFHYAGPDGKFGRQHVRYINSANPVGVDPSDENGKDDYWTINDLHLQKHRPTDIRVTSRDVIHGFALHQMRVQQDAIPGQETPVKFRPIKTGKWQIICAQLCGSRHYAMVADYVVEDKKTFEAFEKAEVENRVKNPLKVAMK